MKWIDRYQSHPVHRVLEDLSTALGQADEKARGTGDAEAVLVRLRRVAEYAGRALSSADPLLAAKAALDAVQAQLAAVCHQVQQFVATENAAHLDSADAEADKVVSPLRNLVSPDAEPDMQALKRALSAFGKLTQDHIAVLEEKTAQGVQGVESLAETIQSLKSTISTERSRIDTAVAQHQEQFSAAQDARQRTFTASEQKRAEEHAAANSARSEAFEEAQEKRSQTFEELISSIEDRHKQRVASIEKSSSELLGEIQERRDKARDLVGIIAGTGMAGGYQKDADGQSRAFWKWNLTTVFGFVGLICFAVWLFVASTGSGEFSWPRLVAKLLVIGAFGLFAVYAGRMAMRHRESERQHRHKQLALESVNSFVEDLDPEVRKAIKQKMAEVFFTQAQRPANADGDVVPTTIDGLLKLVGQAVDALAKRRP